MSYRVSIFARSAVAIAFAASLMVVPALAADSPATMEADTMCRGMTAQEYAFYTHATGGRKDVSVSVVETTPSEPGNVSRPKMRTLSAGNNVALVGSMACKPMDWAHAGPHTKGMTAAQVDAAWRVWLQQTSRIPSAMVSAGGTHEGP